VEFACPVDPAGVEIDGIEEIMQVDFAGEFEIARVQAVLDFLVLETLLRELGDVIVGVGGANLRLFCFAVGGDGCEEDEPAGDDRRRPAEARKSCGPLDVGRLQPCVGEIGVDSGWVGGGSAETWPFGVRLEEGPRKPGHSGSPAKAQATRKSDAMTLFIVL